MMTFRVLLVVLLMSIVLELGLIVGKLPMPSVRAQDTSPVPVYVVPGPFGRLSWVDTTNGGLKVYVVNQK